MPNPLCHFEFMTADPKKCKDFYAKMFDWQFDDQAMPGYTLINTGAEPSGAIFPKPEGADSPCINLYFHVDDIDGTLQRATASGTEILVPKTNIPGVGHFAIISDPEGLAIGMLQPS